MIMEVNDEQLLNQKDLLDLIQIYINHNSSNTNNTNRYTNDDVVSKDNNPIYPIIGYIYHIIVYIYI